MNDDVKSALKAAISESSAIVREQLGNYPQLYLTWRKKPEGRWHGTYHQHPDLHKICNVTRDRLKDAADGFASLFMTKHPEYEGPLGLKDLSHDRIRTYVVGIPESALGWVWYAQGRLLADDSEIDTIVSEFAESIERPTIPVRFQTQILNFGMAADRLIFPDGLIIRRLSEDEVTAIDGGSVVILSAMGSRSCFQSPAEFVVEGEVECDKERHDLESYVNNLARERFDKVILCLRTFKRGHIGYHYIRIRPLKFSLFALGYHGWRDAYVPFGGYRISNEEEGPLQDYAATFFQMNREPAMVMACSRLADAETRTRPHDRLVDAVIGMEAVLLAAIDKGDRRGELRYRFSIHYSTLFDSPEERCNAFRAARDLYDLRSIIAHGSEAKSDRHRVGREKLDLDGAATRATEALRMVVRRFLPLASDAPYRKSQFWDRAYFGLPADPGGSKTEDGKD
jgi:hypothetical protein